MVALIGAHGTGKTTLLRKISEIRPDLIIADGDSRMVKSFNREIGGKLTVREEQLLINRLSDAHWHNQIKNKNLLQTRSPLDHYAYSLSLGMLDYARERAELFSNSDYHKVKFFYVPIEFEIEDDGVRYIDKDFQKEIDEILISLIEEFKIFTETLTGTPEERVEKLLKFI